MSYEFVGLTKNGGIGTAYTSMAEALATAGHEVTCVYIGDPPVSGPDIDHWKNDYRHKKVRLEYLECGAHSFEGRKYLSRSYDVYDWFKRNQAFDIIHFPELLGSGYHTLTAKRQGLIFKNTLICVGIHSMTMWLRIAMQEWPFGISDLELDYMERQSVALADYVVSPSQYLLNWIADQAWTLPADAYVQPYVQPTIASSLTPAARVTKPVDELVFFGRLETRKGIALFCDALDRLAPEAQSRLRQVTFLGRENVVRGVKAREYIETRAKAWRFPVQLLTTLDQPEAVTYLQGTGRAAVIPSLMENSPNTVYECLGAGIPFLASRAGGIPELIREDDAADICFELRSDAFAERLRRALFEGVATSRAAIDVNANASAWIEWHQQAAAGARNARVAKPAASRSAPKVSVCIPTFNRPCMLEQALSSIRATNYRNIEVVVVDDGSFSAEAKTKLAAFESDFTARSWKIVRQENQYPGAARNHAARLAGGEYLFFMDDDDIALPAQIPTLLKVAQHTDADIVTSGALIFQGQEPPTITSQTGAILPLGAAAAVGVYYNCFGEGNFLVKRTTFERLGGFTEDFGVAGEEAEFFAHAVLNQSSLVVVPEFLYWRRDHVASLRKTLSSPETNTRRRLRPYERGLPVMLGGALGLGNSCFNRHRAPGEAQILSAQWQAKLETATMLAQMHLREPALRVMIDIIKSVEASKNGSVLLDALLAVGSAMRPLDPRRAGQLGEMAQRLAKYSPLEAHRLQANQLVDSIRAVDRLQSGSPTAKTPSAAPPS